MVTNANQHRGLKDSVPQTEAKVKRKHTHWKSQNLLKRKAYSTATKTKRGTESAVNSLVSGPQAEGLECSVSRVFNSTTAFRLVSKHVFLKKFPLNKEGSKLI